MEAPTYCSWCTSIARLTLCKQALIQLAPLMLLGRAGVAVPVAIHLFGRRRAPVRRFGAIDFLLGTDRKVARRLKVR